MTDYSELIARLRRHNPSAALMEEAADALEAQARTLSDLQIEVESYRQTNVAKQDALNILTAEVERLVKVALSRIDYHGTVAEWIGSELLSRPMRVRNPAGAALTARIRAASAPLDTRSPNETK